jgi:hypothetical protein
MLLDAAPYGEQWLVKMSARQRDAPRQAPLPCILAGNNRARPHSTRANGLDSLTGRDRVPHPQACTALLFRAALQQAIRAGAAWLQAYTLDVLYGLDHLHLSIAISRMLMTAELQRHTKQQLPLRF